MSKYKRWYAALIKRARARELDSYFEKHHVKPRSLGGSDHERNIARLTVREHFLAHWLLTKMHTGGAKTKMRYALMHVCNRRRGEKIKPWQYKVARRAQVGRTASVETRRKMSLARIGNTNTLGFKASEKTKKKIAKALLGNKNSVGRVLPPEHVAAIRAGHKRYWDARRGV